MIFVEVTAFAKVSAICVSFLKDLFAPRLLNVRNTRIVMKFKLEISNG